MLESSVCIDQPEIETWFAPAGRASNGQIQELANLCLHNPIIQTVLESIDSFVLILNEQRQVLAANQEILETLNVHNSECLYGLRPGEVFSCSNSKTGPDGCGTSQGCSSCGAVISIIASQNEKRPATNECLLSVEHNGKIESHEFHVKSTPLTIDGIPLTIFVLNDISAFKRRDFLESIFIHDLSNMLTGLQGWSDILQRRPGDIAAVAQNIVKISNQLTREVKSQQLLLLAEKRELKVSFEEISVADIFNNLRTFFSGYSQEAVQRIEIIMPSDNIRLYSNNSLLTRVLANMIKNALEATTHGDKVHTYFEWRDEKPCFVVHNPGLIPKETALQIFTRSFSTKSGNGRGLGTYSMKLFGEQYLGGKVSFTTDLDNGTDFFIILPPASTNT